MKSHKVTKIPETDQRNDSSNFPIKTDKTGKFSTHTGVEYDIVDGSVVVPDPYRWLEDLKNDGVKKWIGRQNEFTNGQLRTANGRSRFKSRVIESRCITPATLGSNTSQTRFQDCCKSTPSASTPAP